MRRLVTSVALALAALASGCIAYNDPCEVRVQRPDEEIGYVGETVPLDKLHARHANHALGQLAAEAFLRAYDEMSAPAELGVENGGAIRAEGLCPSSARTELRAGPVQRKAIHEIFLFENFVVAVDLTEPELVEMMEHSVSALVADDPANASDGQLATASGQFLHLAGGTLTVDCLRPAGARVVSLQVGARTVDVVAPREEETYRVAIPSFLLGGGDGYSMLAGLESDLTRSPVQASTAGGTEARIIAAHFQEHYPDESRPLRVDADRIRLMNCARPSP